MTPPRLDGLEGLLPRPAPSEPGFVMLVLADGEVVFRGVAGAADVSTRRPLASDAIFYVGSLAKQFVAACVALLWRDGALDPADPIGRYVPGLAAWGADVTLAHLTHHVAGLPPPVYGPEGLPPSGVPAHDTKDRLARAFTIEALEAEPGARYAYSNLGYVLLAEAVAAVAGEPLSAFARDRIFTPLGMGDSFFRDRPGPLPARAARGHFRAADGARYVEPARFHAVGAGGLWTTVDDLARWDANLGQDRLTDGWLSRQLLTRGRLSDGTSIHYAWGVSVRTHRGLPIVSHGGSFPGWVAKMVRFPDRGVTVICLANDEELDVSALTFRVADHVLAGSIDPSAPHADETLG
ncbi:MAG: serine hydrolase domain-containing protein [Planctomycetaceae bacterium]